MRWKVLAVGIAAGFALLGSSQARAEDGSCSVGQGQSCWQARAACEQRRAEAAEAKLKDGGSSIRDTVLFKTDSAQPVEQTTEIADVASAVKRQPSAHVRLEGYADSRGTEEYNHALSLRRAEAVKRQLVDQGVEKERIDTVPLGEVSPQASNASLEGRALNRRVEIIVEPKGATSPDVTMAPGSTVTPSSTQTSGPEMTPSAPPAPPP